MTVHDAMVSRLIVESLAKKGDVTLEEAKFYTDFTRNILNGIIEETQNNFAQANAYANAQAQAYAKQNFTNNFKKEINESTIIRKLIK